ncbi:hypothetical protein PRIPAC_85664, partial [Pristionchus pacificus]|uniref:Dehydrogenase n=1 Tax=Pristionchus pacificus TaxID=54126 RepID=A0A2A6BV12_PRIPA
FLTPNQRVIGIVPTLLHSCFFTDRGLIARFFSSDNHTISPLISLVRSFASKASGRGTMPVAVITGASSGIGRATSILFAQKKYQLSLTGRNETALAEVVDRCVEAGLAKDDITVTVGDLSAAATCDSIVANTLARFGRIDSLVNAAGILTAGAVLDSPLEQYDRVFDTNVRSLVQLTRASLPHIISAKGTVVNVSSINGPCPFPNVTYYCMSKSAVDQFTKCLALEMAPHGVRVNAVCPGVTVTNLHKRAGQDDATYAAFLEKSKTTHALGRPGEPDEVAKAILFLAGPDSTFTTGDLLRVDGGRGIMHPR